MKKMESNIPAGYNNEGEYTGGGESEGFQYQIPKQKTRIQLIGNAIVYVDFPLKYSRCRGCGKQILWGTTSSGKNMPFNYVTKKNQFESHFSNCKGVNNFRKK